MKKYFSTTNKEYPNKTYFELINQEQNTNCSAIAIKIWNNNKKLANWISLFFRKKSKSRVKVDSALTGTYHTTHSYKITHTFCQGKCKAAKIYKYLVIKKVLHYWAEVCISNNYENTKKPVLLIFITHRIDAGAVDQSSNESMLFLF